MQGTLADVEDENRKARRTARKFVLEMVPASTTDSARLYLKSHVPEGATTDGHRWRIKKISDGELKLSGGGEVVGSIPSGLPKWQCRN